MPDSGVDTISLRDDRSAAKQAASARASKWRRSELAACSAEARYPIYISTAARRLPLCPRPRGAYCHLHPA
jgi:hypothetical protein